MAQEWRRLAFYRLTEITRQSEAASDQIVKCVMSRSPARRSFTDKTVKPAGINWGHDMTWYAFEVLKQQHQSLEEDKKTNELIFCYISPVFCGNGNINLIDEIEQ